MDCSRIVSTITHKRGLHLSPASLFAEKANSFKAEISISTSENEQEKWNGKRVIDLMSIGAVCDTNLIIEAEGEDAEAAVAALDELIKNDFGLDQ